MHWCPPTRPGGGRASMRAHDARTHARTRTWARTLREGARRGPLKSARLEVLSYTTHARGHVLMWGRESSCADDARTSHRGPPHKLLPSRAVPRQPCLRSAQPPRANLPHVLTRACSSCMKRPVRLTRACPCAGQYLSSVSHGDLKPQPIGPGQLLQATISVLLSLSSPPSASS